MVPIKIRYLGQLRCEAEHGPSGAKLITDAPLDNHGRAESFSPTDLVATGLGTCVMTVMGIVAERNGWDLSGTTVDVAKEMVNTPVRRIGKLTVQVHIPHDLPPIARQKLEAAAHTCPVHRSLLAEIESPIQFTYGA